MALRPALLPFILALPPLLLFLLIPICSVALLPLASQEEVQTIAEQMAFELRQKRVSGVSSGARPLLAQPLHPPQSLTDLLDQLDAVWTCKTDRTLRTPLARRLLGEGVQRWTTEGANGTVPADGQRARALLLTLARASSRQQHLPGLGQGLPPNSTLTGHPITLPDGSFPTFAFQLACDDGIPQWTPMAVFPTTLAATFLQLRLPPVALHTCAHSSCQSHCSYSVHGGVRVFARSCCGDPKQADGGTELCREDWVLPQQIFYLMSVVCMLFCAAMIGVVVRERRRQQHDRGWALMEAFFGGAIVLYAIPLLGFPLHFPWSCWVSLSARQLGFSLFYGSVLLKIFRNLQEYRVRKAQHVIVRETDLLMYLLFALFVVLYGILAWSAGSWSRPELWTADWPQCPAEEFTVIFSMCELLVLIYGIRLCYKARNSSWIERYQFTMAIILEALVSLVANSVRYSLSEIGSRDTLFLVAVIQLHLTISVNIAAIITPKFLVSSEGNRRAMGNMSGLGSGGRAHPSLAKMRENLINGTIDFQEVPIVDMNPEDIRAELKRVYTQLRMYKLKNAYQDNPHISKRKGGAKKAQQGGGVNELIRQPPAGVGGAQQKLPPPLSSSNRATAAVVDRRISIPPNVAFHNNPSAGGGGTSGSPKQSRREHQMDNNRTMADGGGPLLLEEDEKSDLTVESAPHNVHFLTSKLCPASAPLATNESIRV